MEAPTEIQGHRPAAITVKMDLLRVVFTTDVRYQSSKVHSTPQQKLHETALAIVTFVAFLTRFVGLEYPSFVVFDEAHTLRVSPGSALFPRTAETLYTDISA